MFTGGYMADPLVTAVTLLPGEAVAATVSGDNNLGLTLEEPGIVAVIQADTVLAVGCPTD